MRIETIRAIDLRVGMIIVPSLRTMRYAKVERVDTLDTREPNKLARNHDQVYITARTDIGPRSFQCDDVVKVLIEGD